MTATQATMALKYRLEQQGIKLSQQKVNMLRRAEKALHRWAEQECGDGNEYESWAIERDEQTGVPYMCRYPHDGKATRYRIPDRERGALDRVREICQSNLLFFYHQGDPRGCALYVSNEPLTDTNYTRGAPCCED